MERIILPYAHPNASTITPRLAGPAHAPTGKGLADMLRAVRRSAPLIAVFTALAGVLGSAYVMKMPPVFRSVAHVQIEPPRFDSNLAIILANNTIPPSDREASEKFVPNRLAWLQGRKLAAEVIHQGQFGPGAGFEADPEIEIIHNISNRRLIPGTNIYEIALEGKEPERVTKLLADVVERFKNNVSFESKKGLTNSSDQAAKSVDVIEKEILKLDDDITAMVSNSPIFAPGRTNLLVEDYALMKSQLHTKIARFDDLRHEDRITSQYPALKAVAPPSRYQQKIDKLEELREYYEDQLSQAARLTRHPNSDPASKRWAKLLEETLDDLEAIERIDVPTELPDRSALMLAHAEKEIRTLEARVRGQLSQIQSTMPEYEQYLVLQAKREDKRQQLAEMHEKLSQFKMVSDTQTNPVEVLQAPSEPNAPSRPNRPLLIVLITGLGFVLGVGLVCAREYVDRTVKVPEHLSTGLDLPILGVIPRMKRLASMHKGGHLWTAKLPLSAEADAYRNVRASLVGASASGGPIVTLMVTSAKPGEGKSTTALNLALAFARAGESTLLIDADLRRSSLAEVFDAAEPNVGLVDVLKGDMPWAGAVVRSGIANLDFLPAGDPSGVPIEILGTLEMRQLVRAAAGEYQRVILDAPAVLGMADCRTLGRMVDAAVLVVRSGQHAMLPIRRAKEMLEQSRVPLAGAVFNALSDDLDNWSSRPEPLRPIAVGASRKKLEASRPEAPAGAGA